jgi:hypothetical protein
MGSGIEKEKKRARGRRGEGLGFYDCTGFWWVGNGKWAVGK